MIYASTVKVVVRKIHDRLCASHSWCSASEVAVLLKLRGTAPALSCGSITSLRGCDFESFDFRLLKLKLEFVSFVHLEPPSGM